MAKAREKVQENFEPVVLPYEPASNPEDRENQLVNAAINLAEQQLLNGTASAQVICHYLKIGSMRERMEMKKLEKEVDLMQAKKENIELMSRLDELYTNALTAMREYTGTVDE